MEPEYPTWFTPLRMLCIFTGMSLIVYLDRGLIASTPVNGRRALPGAAGSGIQGDFALTDFDDGCLPAAFMVGLIVASPTFAFLSRRVQPFKLMGAGLLVWTLAVAACAATWDFWSILVCRMAVGVGEASFVVLAAPFIDEHAPPPVKSIWIAVFLMAIPVGYALGYVYGGVLGPLLGWRLAFLSEASLMLPFVAFAFLTTPIPFSHGPPPVADRSVPGSETAQLLQEEEALVDTAAARSSSNGGEPRSSVQGAARFDRRKLWAAVAPLARDVGSVLGSRTYTLCILGNTAQTALLGMFAYWGPKATTYMFHLPPGHADILFGGVTVLAGIAGTLAGGLLLDALGGSEPGAALVCLVATAASFALLQAAFRLCYTLAPFVVVFAVGQFALFMLQSPVTRIILLSVPPEQRPLAFGIQTIAIHVLGDVPSPPLAGWLHDAAFSADDVAHPQSWRYTAIAFNSVLIAAGAFFAACLSSARADVAHAAAASPSFFDEGAEGSEARSGSAADAAAVSHFAKAPPGSAAFGKRPRRHRGRLMPSMRESMEVVHEARSSAERMSSSLATSPRSFRALDSATSRASTLAADST